MAGVSAPPGLPRAVWAGGAEPGAGAVSPPGQAAAQGRVAGAGRLGPASPAWPQRRRRRLSPAAALLPPCSPQAEERREPLSSKKGGRGSGQVRGSRGRGGVPEKPAAACARSAAAGTPRQRAAPLSAPLGQELSRALQRMEMDVEEEYAYDILWSLMQEQPRYTFRAADVPRAMTAERRALIVDWLVQVHEYLKLVDDTLYLAVYLMNAYLKRSPAPVGLLQLLSLACLFLACKVEESSCPPPAQLCFIAEDAFSPKELLRMERKILSRLKFELHYANPVSLLRLLAEVGRASLEVQYLAMYFMELSLMETNSVVVEPALLAVAALGLAQRVLCDGTAGSQGPQGSPPKLHMYSEAELSAVYPSMARAALQGGGSTLQATFQKYSRSQKLCTSTKSALADSAYLRRFLGGCGP